MPPPKICSSAHAVVGEEGAEAIGSHVAAEESRVRLAEVGEHEAIDDA